ncbi:MAG: hypothetical protein ACMUIP_10825 [bacterium]
MRHFLSVAKEKEITITKDEIGMILSTVMAVSAGRIRAHFSDVIAEMDTISDDTN